MNKRERDIITSCFVRSCYFTVFAPLQILEVLLAVIVGDEHERVGDDGSWDARGEAAPEAQPAAFVPVDIDRAVDHATVGNEWVILLKSQRNLADLQLGLDDVLWVGYEPGEETADAACDELRKHAKVVGAL